MKTGVCVSVCGSGVFRVSGFGLLAKGVESTTAKLRRVPWRKTEEEKKVDCESGGSGFCGGDSGLVSRKNGKSLVVMCVI